MTRIAPSDRLHPMGYYVCSGEFWSFCGSLGPVVRLVRFGPSLYSFPHSVRTTHTIMTVLDA